MEFLIGAVAGDASDTGVHDLDSAGVVAAAHETLAR
jgi:hypothetical protein